MHIKKNLGFTALRKMLSKRFLQIEDPRKGSVKYKLHDFFMSAFAMMYFQDPSLLSFQERLQIAYNKNNLKTMFDIESIPKDSQLREILDQASTESIKQTFSDFLHQLQRGNQLKLYQFLDSRYLIPLDGSGYFSSKKICCPSCLQKKNKKTGEIRYQHQILQAAIVHPDMKQVLPLAPEPIKNTDGSKKQDCEINASKRMISQIRKEHPKLNIIITGDGLYSKQPFIDELKTANMSYILVAKPKDHKILYEWFEELKGLEDIQKYESKGLKGKRYVYEWINQIPLNGSEKSDDIFFLLSKS